MSNLSKPYTFSSNTTASSSEVNANFDTLYNDYNGGISAVNLAAGAVTSAKLATAAVFSSGVKDTSGNEVVEFSETASAVNNIDITNAATGNAPSIAATGGDTNIDLNLVSKGTGTVQVNGNPIDSEWSDWTPTWTNLTVGSATTTYARFSMVGKTIHYRLQVVLAGDSSVGTQPRFSLPVTAASNYADTTTDVIGTSTYLDASTGDNKAGEVVQSSATNGELRVHQVDNEDINSESCTASVPFIWAGLDVIAVSGTYEAA